MYTSKAFRRGATQELIQTGNALDVIKGSGGWQGSGIRSYGDLEVENAFRISRRPIALSDADSPEDDRENKGDKPHRRNWRKKDAAQKSDTSSVSSTESGTPRISIGHLPALGVQGILPPIMITKRTKHPESSKLFLMIDGVGSAEAIDPYWEVFATLAFSYRP